MEQQSLANVQIVGTVASVVAAIGSLGAIAVPFMRDAVRQRNDLQRRLAIVTRGETQTRSRVQVTFRPVTPEPTGFEVHVSAPDLWFGTSEQVGDTDRLRDMLELVMFERHEQSELTIKLNPDAHHEVYQASFVVAGREGRPGNQLLIQLRISGETKPIISRTIGVSTTA